MQILKPLFFYAPGGENEKAGSSSSEENTNAAKSTETNTEGEHHGKGIVDKIKDALRDWSRDDQAQQDFDDTRV